MNRRPDILCISSIDWDHIWQGHQEIMSRLAADGHRVLFIENTGVRGPAMGDMPRVRKRLLSWWRATKGFREDRPNLFLYSALLLPFPYSRLARWVNRFFVLRALRRWMTVTGFHQPILWSFLPTPLSLDIIHDVDPQITIYYCIDDLASSSPGAWRIASSEEQMFREADLVFVTSEHLQQRASRFSERVHFFPFGVNIEKFTRARQEASPRPADLPEAGRPLAGYVGGLHQWVDQDLLVNVAKAMPDVTFVLVGPAQTDVSRLAAEPNVLMLGQKSHGEVPGYVKAFDVALIPYRLTEYTTNVYPTKLNEYLAMGKAVVATGLHEILRFNQAHDQIVRVAGDAPAFAGAVREALAEQSSAHEAARITVAESNSWGRRIEAMNTLIDRAIDSRAARRQRWDAALRRVYQKARGHSAKIIFAALGLYLLVFQTNLVWWAGGPLRMTAPPARADVIVVFAAGVGESGEALGGHQERLKQAVDLYKAGHANVVILSSGFVYSFKEAEVLRALAIDQGVPASQLVLEERATNTFENVTNVTRILRDKKWTSVLLVSSPYHMRRAMLVWRKQAPEVAVVPAAPENSQFYEHTTGASPAQVRGILQEYVAIAWYWWRGWL